MLIYTTQEILCTLVCILESSFIKSPVIIIILLKGALINAFIFVFVGGVGPSKCRKGKMLKFCKYNTHHRKWTTSTEKTHNCIKVTKLLSATFKAALNCNYFGTVQYYITQHTDPS